MSNSQFSAVFMNAVSKSMFNASGWQPYGDAYPLLEIWKAQGIDLNAIDGDKAEVIEVSFNDGSTGLRIAVPFKDGSKIEIRLSGKSDLLPGDIVKISSITGQELRKAGSEPIVRFDGEIIE